MAHPPQSQLHGQQRRLTNLDQLNIPLCTLYSAGNYIFHQLYYQYCEVQKKITSHNNQLKIRRNSNVHPFSTSKYARTHSTCSHSSHNSSAPLSCWHSVLKTSMQRMRIWAIRFAQSTRSYYLVTKTIRSIVKLRLALTVPIPSGLASPSGTEI